MSLPHPWTNTKLETYRGALAAVYGREKADLKIKRMMANEETRNNDLPPCGVAGHTHCNIRISAQIVQCLECDTKMHVPADDAEKEKWPAFIKASMPGPPQDFWSTGMPTAPLNMAQLQAYYDQNPLIAQQPGPDGA